YLSCEEFVKELTDPLHYFSSKQYQDLKTELDSNLSNVVSKCNQTQNSVSEKKNKFFRKLNEVKPSLNIHLKQSKCGLDKFRKIISEGKSFYSRIENDIKNHKRVIKDYTWFYSPDITTISSEIILPFNLIEKKLLQIAHEISHEVENILLSKIEVFKQKINGYLDDLKEVTKKIDHLKFKNRKRECVEERLTIKVDSTKATTYKTTKPEKENKLIDELSQRKSELRRAIENTIDSHISFLDRTYSLLKEDYMSALIEKNKINLSVLLINTKSHLDSYDAKFPKQEKRDLENLIKEINTLTNIDDLINRSRFKYQGELRKCDTLLKKTSELIEKTIKKLEELESLSNNSHLTNKYKVPLIEDSNSLQLTNSKLKSSCNKLIYFKKELSVYNSLLRSLRLNIEKSAEEKEYDELSFVYNKSYSELNYSKKIIDISKICYEINSVYSNSKGLFFI
ncbi:MAG: hypothetical protein ACRCSV_04670, partial [Chlamydiales bacterium]